MADSAPLRAQHAAAGRDVFVSAAAVAEREAAFDLMRCAAAVAVIAVHVVGPYRDLLGDIPDAWWITAVAFNGLGRWAVPVFIMVTGALMLADRRPFEPGRFVRRRLLKVLVPFLWWSVLYAGLAGLSLQGFDAGQAAHTLESLPTEATYYHLGFFYYFIPLYLLIWPLRSLVERASRWLVVGLVTVWLALTAAYLAGVSGPWRVDLVMYGGYLLLGYAMWRIGAPPLWLLAAAGVAAAALAGMMVVDASLEAERYSVGRWYSYKTLNTVCVAALMFVLALRLAPRLPARAAGAIAFAGRHTLGIYLLHPLFLWPMRELDLYLAHPLLVVPLWTALAGGLALGGSVLLARSRLTAWMVP